MLRVSCYRNALIMYGLIGLATAGGSAFGRGFPAAKRVLNPRTYLSPSGQYALLVDPSDLNGRHGASYRLTKQGREVWSSQQPFTLWEAVVSDHGVVGGYAYTFGWDGVSEGGYKAGCGDFHAVLIDARGKLRLDQVTKREDSQFPHAPPNPTASGLFLDAVNHRLVVRVCDSDLNRSAESWWVYQVSTGKALGSFRPKQLMPDPEPAQSILDARPVAGTALTLVHWWRYEEDRDDRDGARFTLVDPAGKPVWSLDWPSDYHIPNDEAAENRRGTELHNHGAILRSDQPGQFELWRARDAERVTFCVTPGAGGKWLVADRDRRPYVAPVKVEPPPAQIPEWRPHVLGRIALRLTGRLPAPPIRGVRGFVFNGQGRIAFIRWEHDEAPTFVLVDQAGKVLRSLALPTSKDGPGPTNLAWLDGDRFLIVRGSPHDREKIMAERIDAATGGITPLEAFDFPTPSKIVGFPDGEFVVLDSMQGALTAFDARAARRWSLQADLMAKNLNALYIPTDIAVTTRSRIALVDASRHTVQLFDRAGKHERTIELEKAWKSEPRYPSAITTDLDGGFLVHDFQGSPPLFRMSADGTVRARIDPKYADGRRFRLPNGARVAPDGHVWTCDGHAILRLDGSGTVDRVLGESPNVDRLDEAAAVTLDTKGRIYAVAGRTGTVHVFDPEGRWLLACKPDPGDLAKELYWPDITVSDSGDVLMSVSKFDDPRRLRFSPEGKRLGFEAAPVDSFSQHWHMQPRTSRRWVECSGVVLLVEPSGKVIRTIARRADGIWLEDTEAASVAPDGSIAVLAESSSLVGGPFTLNLYTAQGDPIRTFHLPGSIKWNAPRVAYDGKHVVIVQDDQIFVFNPTGEIIGRLTPLPTGERDSVWTPFLSREGRELLLFNGGNAIYRFAMP